MWFFDVSTIAGLLGTMDQPKFVAVCNDLLYGFADSHGIDRSCISTTDRINDKDGGIDARCEGAAPAERLIPSTRVIYQFKSGGGQKSARELALSDIIGKPKVAAALRDGWSFVYLAAWDKHAGDFAGEIVGVLTAEGLEVYPDQIRFFGGRSVAAMIQPHQALSRHFGGLPLKTLEDWGHEHGMTNPYRTDDRLEAQIRNLRGAISTAQARVRLVGRAGDGKTRMTLETLQGSGLEDTVAYVPDPDMLTPDLVDRLRRMRTAICTVVVDECDNTTHDRLLDAFEPMPAGVRLITIGIDAGAPAEAGARPVLRVDGLDSDLLTSAMGAVAPTAPEGAVKEAAAACGGSPKLAILLAERMNEDPELARLGPIRGHRRITGALDRYLAVDIADPTWRALSVVALLERVGWAGDLEHESETLFRAASLDPIAARQRVIRHHERHGIAPSTRRFRYISPTILADYLAAQQIEAWTRKALTDFYQALTPPMRERFGRRLRRIASSLENRATIEEVILGDHGPFRTIGEAEEGGMTSLLTELAGPLRQAAVRALVRMIEGASEEELTNARRSRRDLVNALTELLWFEETFQDGAAMLLRLAVSENETWANNATGIWVETFQMQLGRTAAPGPVRVRIVASAARSPDARARLLAAKAIEAALKMGGTHRMGMPPRAIEGAPDEAWRPKTYGEWSDAYIGYLGLLRALVEDDDASVREAAVAALADAAEGAYGLARVGEVWAEIALRLEGAEYALRARMMERIKWVIHRGENELEGARSSADQAHEVTVRGRLELLFRILRTLEGADFSSRFRRTIDYDPWRGLAEDGEAVWSEGARPLAMEVVETPELLHGELEWLLGFSGTNPERFFELLGRVDADRRAEPVIRGIAKDHERAIRWSSLYDLSHSQATGNEEGLEQRIQQLASHQDAAPWALDLILITEATTSRMETLIKLFESGDLPSESIRRLQFTPALRRMTPDQLSRLARVALDSADGGVAILLTLLSFYLREHPDSSDSLKDMSLAVIDRPMTRDVSRRLEFEWSEIAKAYVESEPISVARAALKWIENQESTHVYGVQEILQRAMDATSPEAFFFEVVTQWLDRDDLSGWWVMESLPSAVVRRVKADRLFAWIDERPERVRRVARVLGQPTGERVSDLHAEMLRRYDAEWSVGSVFFGELISGTWTGSAAARTRGLRDEVGRWVGDDRPEVAAWASEAKRSFEAQLEHEEMIEEEEEHFGFR